MTEPQAIQIATTAGTVFVSGIAVGWGLFRMMLNRLDLSEQRITDRLQGIDVHLATLNGTVARHESDLRRGSAKFGKLAESMEDIRRVCFAQLDDLNTRRSDKGLPPIELD